MLATFINITDIYKSNNLINHIFKVIITFLVIYILSFVCALLYYYFKRRVIYLKYNRFKVSGTYGNILDYIGASKVNLIVPVNCCFDTKIDDSVISTNSLHGKVIKFLYDNNLVSQTELDKKIKRSLREQNISSVNIGNDVKKGGKSVGNYNRYPIGSTAFVDIGDVRYHFIALSIIENNKNAITSDQDYLIVLNAIVDNCFRNSNGKLIDICKQTITSDNQLLSDKYSSFNLLFQIYFSQIHDLNWSKLIDILQSNRNTLLVHSDFTDENPIILSIQLNVMKSIYDGNYNLVINDILKLSDENIFEIKRVISFLRTIFEFDKFSPSSEFIMFCTYFCLNMTKHYSRNIKMNAADLLIKLTKYEIVNQIILNQLSNMMDCSNSDIKLVIVTNIDKIISNGDYKDYIIEKAKLDNHHLVIKYANEYRMENSNE